MSILRIGNDLQNKRYLSKIYTGVRPQNKAWGLFCIVQILCKTYAKLCQIVQKYDIKRKVLTMLFNRIKQQKTAEIRGFYLGSPNQIRTGVLALKGRMYTIVMFCFY